MKKLLFALALACSLITPAFAQTATITATKILDTSGNLLASGQWCFGATCFAVTNGAIPGGSTVTDATAAVTVTSGGSTYLTVPSVAISGTAFSWDTFVVPTNTTISGMGNPRIACAVGATYTQTDSVPANMSWSCAPINGAATWLRGIPNYPAGSGLYGGNGAPTFTCAAPCVYVRGDASPQTQAMYALVAPSGAQSSNWQPQGGTGGGGGGFTFSGAYSGSTTYALGAVVTSGASTYISLQASNTNNTPASSPTYWSAFADAPGAAAAAAAAGLQKANNLSDLASASTARTNLGLGTAAVTASTAYDAAGAAAAVQASISAYVPFNPIAVSAEYAFNSGAGSSATTVADLTGNGNTANLCTGTNAPTWTADGIQFLAGTDSGIYRCVTTPFTTWKSLAITFEVDAPPASGVTSGVTISAYATMFGAPISATTGVNVSTIATGFSVVPRMQTANAGGIQSSAVQGYGGRHTLVVVPGVPDAYYIDCNLQAGPANSVITSVTSSGGYQFGTGSFGALNAFRGKILYATIDTAHAWTAAQACAESIYQQRVIQLRPLTSFSPATTSTRGNLILADGDSLLAGRAGTGQFTSYLTLNNTYSVTNVSVSGELMRDIDWLAPVALLPQSATGAAKVYAITNGSSNDLAAGLSDADTMNSISDFARQAKAAGAIPIYSTAISRGSSMDAAIEAHNVTVRANYKAWGFAAIIDDAERPEFSLGGYANSTFYQSDGTHLTGGNTCVTTTGYGLRCVGMSKVINTLDGSSKESPDISTSNAYVETDANNYIIQTPTAAATHQLVDCSWITGLNKTVVNPSTFAITATTTASQTITGSATVAAGSIGVFTAQVTSPTTGGCYWLRTQ